MMTLMIRRRALIFIILLPVAAVITVAALGFVAAGEAAALDPPAAKALAERVLFAGIITTVIVVSAGGVVIWRTTNFNALLDQLIEMNSISGFSPDIALNKLGDVGRKITAIYRQVAELSTKKSRKISSLTALNELLLYFTDKMVLVIDATGHVLQASAPLLTRIEQTLIEVQKSSLDDLIPGAEIDAAIKEASKSHAPVVRERKGESLVLNPVMDKDGEVS